MNIFSWGDFVDRNMNCSDYGDMNDNMFNPTLQYEQACMYYKYMTAQMEYRIKCKEYEKLCRGGKIE